MKPGEGIVSWVVKTVMPAVVNDVKRPPRLSGASTRSLDFNPEHPVCPDAHRRPTVRRHLTGIADKMRSSFSGNDKDEYLGSRPGKYSEKSVEPELVRAALLKIPGL